ncbi:hypothetical protein DDK22_35440 [Cupriavidus necator]|uniref:Uncharacterized protein n=1 Tax=Cupriavidus necator TaxID=106590 RepID=A0A367P874_CUPNE|nr:hypothetical protein DDK22_35440 [Cupriavidus necator]
MQIVISATSVFAGSAINRTYADVLIDAHVRQQGAKSKDASVRMRSQASLEPPIDLSTVDAGYLLNILDTSAAHVGSTASIRSFMTSRASTSSSVHAMLGHALKSID